MARRRTTRIATVEFWWGFLIMLFTALNATYVILGLYFGHPKCDCEQGAMQAKQTNDAGNNSAK